MKEFFCQTFLLFLPAFLANGFPVLAKIIPGIKKLFNYSIEDSFGKNNQDIFGKNKTWIGLLLGVLGGIIGALIVKTVLGSALIENSSLFNLYAVYWLPIGAVLGLGAMLGDLLKSFFKRRFKIASGRAWPPFDQIDFILGAWLFSGLFIPWQLSWPNLILALLITPPLHLLSNLLAFKLKLKAVWW